MNHSHHFKNNQLTNMQALIQEPAIEHNNQEEVYENEEFEPAET
jgi:hypothetical protein